MLGGGLPHRGAVRTPMAVELGGAVVAPPQGGGQLGAGQELRVASWNLLAVVSTSKARDLLVQMATIPHFLPVV